MQIEQYIHALSILYLKPVKSPHSGGHQQTIPPCSHPNHFPPLQPLVQAAAELAALKPLLNAMSAWWHNKKVPAYIVSLPGKGWVPLGPAPTAWLLNKIGQQARQRLLLQNLGMPKSACFTWVQHLGSFSSAWALIKCKIRHWAVVASHKTSDLPSLMIFFQFQSPKWSSSISRSIPSPISLVLCAAGLILAQPHSGTSPSVLPTPFVRLNEKAKLHASTWTGRWNFGTRNWMYLMYFIQTSSWGKIFIHSQRFLCHWHAMS